MDKIKILNVKRLLKELDYIESDFEYRTEVISEADSEFIKSIDLFLNEHPDLKDVYNNKLNEKIDKSIKSQMDEAIKNEEESEAEATDIKLDPEQIEEIPEEIEEPVQEDLGLTILKTLYREIVKLTHPDKIKKKKLNDLYIKATEYYDKRDKLGLYKICTELGIEFKLEETDEEIINIKIEDLKKRINFLESTYTWKWFNCKDEVEKNQILLNYIKLRIS